jgi:sugar phosphate isomerase/epimerase
VKIKRKAMVDEIKRALEISETIPFRYLIQHIGVAGEEYDERKLDSAFTALEEISLFARQRGAEVLLENTPNALSSAERLVLFLESTHLDLNFCIDVGHANMNEGVDTAFRTMRHRLRSTHIHDNNGVDDSHLFPLVAQGGTIDWGRTMDSLSALDVPLLLELKDVPGLEHPLDAVRESIDRLEQSRGKSNLAE